MVPLQLSPHSVFTVFTLRLSELKTLAAAAHACGAAAAEPCTARGVQACGCPATRGTG